MDDKLFPDLEAVPNQASLMPDIVDHADPTPQAIEEAASRALDGLYQRWYKMELADKEEINVTNLGWMAIYHNLVEMGWENRKAALIAWKAYPGDKWPATQQEFAKLLGMKSDRRFYVWRQEDPTIDIQIETIWQQMVKDQIKEVDAVNLKVAKEADYKATQERRLFYQRHGVLQEDGPRIAVQINNVQNLPEAELDKLIAAGQGLLKGKTVEADFAEVDDE